MDLITLDQAKKAIPRHLASTVTQDIVDTLNDVQNPEEAERFRENFINYGHVLTDGKFCVTEYLNAIKYVSFKLMGLTNQDAYFKAFPDRYQNLLAAGRTAKEISAYVAAYHKGKLVNQIMEQAAVPTWLINQDLFQKAINVQAELMTDPDVSPKVRSDAANSLLTHLKRPEAAAPAININLNPTSAVDDLRNTLASLAQQQKELIQGGMTAKRLAEQTIIEGEVIDG